MSDTAPLVVMKGIGKSFRGVTALKDVDLDIMPGEVHALATFLREHGASTVVVGELDYVFARDNPLYAKLENALAPLAGNG